VNSSAGNPEELRLRTFWNDRYSDFTLSESGWKGAGEELNRFIYRCKQHALVRSLTALGWRDGARFSVLDAGCGQGFFAGFYRQEFPNAAYVGVDISERAIAHLQKAAYHGEFHAADLATWTHPRQTRFDVVQSLEVLHLILDDDTVTRAIGNLASQLNGGGSLLVTAALPESTIDRSGYLRYRSRRFWLDAVKSLDLRIVASRPIYYWLPAGGPANRYARFLFTRLGVPALYLTDRAAVALRVPQSRAAGPDCRMRLLTIQHSGR
jgi:SAM-dependent methyltransferase